MKREQLELLREYVQAEIGNVVKLHEFQDWSAGHEAFEKLCESFEKLCESFAEAPELPQTPVEQRTRTMVAIRAVETLADRILGQLDAKTGWGRNEVKAIVNVSLQRVVSELQTVEPPPPPPAPPPTRTCRPANKLPWE